MIEERTENAKFIVNGLHMGIETLMQSSEISW